MSVTRTPGLDAATVALPAGISLDDRAARMNDFWKALAEFQYRNVMVVAICADSETDRTILQAGRGRAACPLLSNSRQTIAVQRMSACAICVIRCDAK